MYCIYRTIIYMRLFTKCCTNLYCTTLYYINNYYMYVSANKRNGTSDVWNMQCIIILTYKLINGCSKWLSIFLLFLRLRWHNFRFQWKKLFSCALILLCFCLTISGVNCAPLFVDIDFSFYYLSILGHSVFV